MPRIFVALELPTTVKRGLERLCAGLPGARWLSTDQYHLTLRFIGDVDGTVFKDVTAALDGIDRDGFTLSLTGLGYFALFTSFLSHNGAIHTLESSFPLRWPAGRIDATPR